MDLIHRLHQRLIDVLASNPGSERNLTIGDLYQRLIPYRSVRGELGVMELAAYEHGLLRLLAGEGAYLEVESADALEEFGRELASVNPILGIYRDYADVPVIVRTAALVLPDPEDADPESLPPDFADGAAPTPEPDSTLPTEADPSARKFVGPERFGPAPSAAEPSRPAGPNAERDRCGTCDASLPALPGLRFCPYCGAKRPPSPCARCATPLEADWNFCIRCGTPVDDRAPLR